MDLNLRSLFVGFTEEGLLQRFVDVKPIFDGVQHNRSLQRLNLSENLLEDGEIELLSNALLQRQVGLRVLDVGDNPFEEHGASKLVRLLRGHRSIHNIRFENHFIDYKRSDLVKLLAEFNHYDHRLLRKDVDIALALWPLAFAKVQKHQERGDDATSEARTTNHMFRFLRSATGPFGHELSLRIAMNRREN